MLIADTPLFAASVFTLSATYLMTEKMCSDIKNMESSSKYNIADLDRIAAKLAMLEDHKGDREQKFVKVDAFSAQLADVCMAIGDPPADKIVSIKAAVATLKVNNGRLYKITSRQGLQMDDMAPTVAHMAPTIARMEAWNALPHLSRPPTPVSLIASSSSCVGHLSYCTVLHEQSRIYTAASVHSPASNSSQLGQFQSPHLTHSDPLPPRRTPVPPALHPIDLVKIPTLPTAYARPLRQPNLPNALDDPPNPISDAPAPKRHPMPHNSREECAVLLLLAALIPRVHEHVLEPGARVQVRRDELREAHALGGEHGGGRRGRRPGV